MEKRIFLAWCICLIMFRWHSINAQEYWKTLDYLVGPQAMPQGVIESYETNPFALPQLNYPSFPNYVVNIKNEGAEEGKPITALVNRLIKMVNERGGGKVVIPEGYWKSGRIELKSNVNLCVEEHAVIEFSGIPTDYLPSVYTMHEGVRIMGAGAFIYAYGAENIAITGRGKLIGPSMDFPTRQNRGFNSLASVSESFPADYRQRVFDGMEGRRFFSPKVISPVCCKNVLIEGIIIERSLFWNVNPILCENVIVRGVTVNSVGIASGDGIDLSCCKNVLVEYCTMNGDGGVWVERGENHMLEATTNRLCIFRANTGVHVNHFSLRSAIGSHCDTRRNGRLIIINVTRRIVSRVSRTISSDYSPTQRITQRLIPLCFPSRDRQSHHNL